MVHWKTRRTASSTTLGLRPTPEPSMNVTLATSSLETGSERAWTSDGLGPLLHVFVSLLTSYLLFIVNYYIR